MERYEIGVSINNLRNWNILEAVKEVVQNNVYAKTILGDECSIVHDGTYVIIKNSPSGFTKGKLIIGESEQAGVEGAPGSYGEGLKMAMLVARRLNRKCHIETNGFTVYPEIEPSTLDPEVQTLVFYIEENDNTEGTTCYIECDEDILKEACSYFAILNNVNPETVKINSIIPDTKAVFINGVKISETNSILGYNFTDEKLMNRDRTTVDGDLVIKEVRVLLQYINSVPLARTVLKGILEDDTLMESQAGVFYHQVTNPKYGKQQH